MTENRPKKDSPDNTIIHVSGKVANFEITLAGIKKVTINFEELDIDERKQIRDILSKSCHRRRQKEESTNLSYKHTTSTDNTNSLDTTNYSEPEPPHTHKDYYGKNIYKGDTIEILTEGKLGTTGDLAEVYKLSNNSVVCYNLKNNKSTQGHRKSYNVALKKRYGR